MEKTYFISREDFINLKAAWKRIPAHTAADMVIYNVLRSKSAASGFVPKTKNIQGNDAWWAFISAKSAARAIVMRSRRSIKTEHISAISGKPMIRIKWEDVPADEHNEMLKAKWGIDLPVGLADLIKESKHD